MGHRRPPPWAIINVPARRPPGVDRTPTAERSTSTRRMPPLFGDAAADGLGHQRQRQAHRNPADLHHRQRGPDDHVSTHPFPVRSSAASSRSRRMVDDHAGVLDSSVIAVIGDETGTPLFEIPLKPRGAGVYGALFDTARLTSAPIRPRPASASSIPTISFRASDQLGNETRPRLRLRARQHRAGRRPRSAERARSSARTATARASSIRSALNRFDGDMPNDTTVVPQVFDLRARIQDDGNAPAGPEGVRRSRRHRSERDQRLHPRRRDPAADRRHRRRRLRATPSTRS